MYSHFLWTYNNVGRDFDIKWCTFLIFTSESSFQLLEELDLKLKEMHQT